MPRHDRDRTSLAVEHDPVLGQIQFERSPRPPRPVEHREGAVQRVETLRRERQHRVGRAITGRLNRFVGQPRRRAHQRPLEAMSPLTPGGVDPQMRCDAGAVLARFQGAQIVRERLWQHRHDPVGEVDRIAAMHRFAVEGAARPDVMADIGDRDDDMPAAAVFRIGIRFGPDGIIEIARILAVDRDQGEIAQIGAARQIDRLRGRRFGEGLARKLARDVEGGDREPADRSRRIGRPQPLDDARPLAAEAARRQLLGDDQLAIRQPHRVVAEHPVLALVAAVGRDHFAAVAGTTEHADDAALRCVQPAHRLGFGLAGLAADQPRQRTGALR